MTAIQKNIIEDKIQQLRLPVFPNGVIELLDRLGQQVEITQMVEVLENFPSIVAKLLALANSSWSSPSTQITSLHEACTRLGFNVVCSVSIALAISSPFDVSRCRGFDVQAYWCNALMVAEAAFLLQEQAAPETVQTARTAGLIYNLGLVWLADNFAEEVSAVLTQTDSNTGLNERMQQTIGIAYDQATVMLAQALCLPETLIQIISEYRHSVALQSDPQACLIYLSDYLVHSVRHGGELHTEQSMTALFDEALQQQVFSRLLAIYPQITQRAAILFSA